MASTPPNPPNDQRFSIPRSIMQAFLRLSNLRNSQSDIIPRIPLQLPLSLSPTSNSITTITWTTQPLDYTLPPYMNSIDIEMQSDHPRATPVSLAKITLSLTFQLVAAMALSSSLGQAHVLPMHLIQVAVVLAFSASFIGICLRNAYPSFASISDRIGFLFAAMGFYLMTSVFLTGNFTWISWLGLAMTFLACLISSIK